MTTDLALVLGIVVAVFSFPSILSAFSDFRAPRTSAITILIAGTLVLYAIQTKPGYTLEDVPNAFILVAADYIP